MRKTVRVDLTKKATYDGMDGRYYTTTTRKSAKDDVSNKHIVLYPFESSLLFFFYHILICEQVTLIDSKEAVKFTRQILGVNMVFSLDVKFDTVWDSSFHFLIMLILLESNEEIEDGPQEAVLSAIENASEPR